MLITICRSYFPTGTNGRLYINGAFQCYTIELPWLNNMPQHSCIPEGDYFLAMRFSRKFGTHLLVRNIDSRDLILIHPANNAFRELKGCIAPVTVLQQAPGTGTASKLALKKILALILPVLEKEKIILSIKKFNDDT